MTPILPDWRARARALAGAVRLPDGDPRWPAAVAAVPRHAFVPRFLVQAGRQWRTVDATDPDWADRVYSDVPLVTAVLPDSDGHQVVVSSSSKPGMMVRMLDALDLADGHDVLEVGTGTGYNAGLLCHPSGAEHVSSVDIGADLVRTARARLADLGWWPHLAVGDGLAGLPDRAPFDRIIATCSVATVPTDWIEQVRPGGRVLVDLKVGLHAGNLVLLHRGRDGLQGRFLPRWAGFMPARPADVAPPQPHRPGRVGPERHRTTTVDPDPWAALVPWFLAHAGRSPVTGFGRRGPGLATTCIFAADGSWCEVGPLADGVREVREGGPDDLWRRVEAAHEEWRAHGGPGWERIGLTVEGGGGHRIWLDRPENVLLVL